MSTRHLTALAHTLDAHPIIAATDYTVSSLGRTVSFYATNGQHMRAILDALEGHRPKHRTAWRDVPLPDGDVLVIASGGAFGYQWEVSCRSGDL